MFYTFDQNNSGGFFHHDPAAGIGYAVIIEASSHKDANDRAERIGLYFNGCDDDIDCSCCGDRWYASYDKGTEEPEMYGKPPTGKWGIPTYIHYLDGRIARVESEGGMK